MACHFSCFLLAALEGSQCGCPSFPFLVQHVEHVPCVRGTYLRDDWLRDTSMDEFPAYRACFKTIHKKAFSCVGILLHFNLVHVHLGLELFHGHCLQKLQSFHLHYQFEGNHTCSEIDTFEGSCLHLL